MLSAVLDNVTTVIFTYPMASQMAKRLKVNASAFLLPMVMAANIGGTATLIGDPPNVLIGADARTGLAFMDFILNLTVPCALIATGRTPATTPVSTLLACCTAFVA